MRSVGSSACMASASEQFTPGALSGKTDGAVDRAGVHIDQTKATRSRAGDRTFSGTGRAVNGNGNMSIQSVDSFPCHVQTALPAT